MRKRGRNPSGNSHGKFITTALSNPQGRCSIRLLTRSPRKSASEYYDPCQDFADRSLKCMKRNGFDREMCMDYFQYVAPDFRISLFL